MNRRATSMATALAGLLTSWVPARAGDPLFEPDRAIVRLAPGVTIGEINSQYGSTDVASVVPRRLYLLDIPDGFGEESFAQLLAQDPRVEFAQVNFFAKDPGPGTQSFYLASIPGAFVAQYAVQRIALAPAHTLATGSGVVIAILDGGADAAHPTLAGRVLGTGYNFVNGNTNIADAPDGIDSDGDGLFDEMVGHGTFVSGVALLAAPGAMILPVKVMDSDGVSTSFRVAQGVDFAIAQGARVLNLSLGSLGENVVLDEAMSWAEGSGATIVAAAGNEGNESPGWAPSTHPSAIAIAATNPADVKAPFSNYGQHIDLCAPGVTIVGTLPGGAYGSANGTSYSAPLVAGVAALVIQREPTITHAALVQRLKDTAQFIDPLNPGYQGMLGAGRLNAHAALLAGCYPDCNGDGTPTVADFGCFQSRYVTGNPYADCNASGTLSVADFGCFQGAYVAGCP